MKPELDPESIARALLAPYTIGELKKAIEHMDDNIMVFSFSYGNIDGMCSWKRKETWKQWCKQQKQVAKNEQK